MYTNDVVKHDVGGVIMKNRNLIRFYDTYDRTIRDTQVVDFSSGLWIDTNGRIKRSSTNVIDSGLGIGEGSWSDVYIGSSGLYISTNGSGSFLIWPGYR